MNTPLQLPLFPTPASASPVQEMGTFKDSLRAPVHSWFRYPAGFSNQFIDTMFDRFSVGAGDWVYDPFSGTGTTLVCAKARNIHAVGIEAHTFVHWVSTVKLDWDFDYTHLRADVQTLLSEAHSFIKAHADRETDGVFPELVYKCYAPSTLKTLYLLRLFIEQRVLYQAMADLLKLALTDTLRTASAAGTGWPYIAPNKNTGDKPPKDAFALFSKTALKMVSDLYQVGQSQLSAIVTPLLGDSRERQPIEGEQMDFAITSPPYLNNYDYADRTRLETYFWGITKSWREITEQFRDKLMTAATTQITRSRYDVGQTLSTDIALLDGTLYPELQDRIAQLTQLRGEKGGKKDYDLMVALYFNDMTHVLQETYRVLKPGATFCLVIGDSAPYGVHIPTDMYLSRIALGLGFRHSDYEAFRTRGGKWKANPQRHRVPLREGMLRLSK